MLVKLNRKFRGVFFPGNNSVFVVIILIEISFIWTIKGNNITKVILEKYWDVKSVKLAFNFNKSLPRILQLLAR